MKTHMIHGDVIVYVPATSSVDLGESVNPSGDGKESTITILQPADNKDGNFYLENAKDIKNIYIADVHTTIQGVALETKASINIGQNTVLKVSTEPEKITEAYELVWKSSDDSVASVDQDGKITGKKQGTTTIRVSVKENENIKFIVKGYGHGVGMSQTGADSLAKQGSNCEDIIHHFYANVEIKQINEIL